ncbi:MAG: hypothetical protein HXY22_13480 [Alphaproteobacteria bacterium]|nr:hypothetical protein [Alphaproteobacteria bacterium]
MALSGTFAFCIVAGFIFSNALANFILLITRQSAPLVYRPRNDMERIAALGLVTFTGPAVLFDNALKSYAETQRPFQLCFSLGIVFVWSFLIGVVVVRTLQLAGLI